MESILKRSLNDKTALDMIYIKKDGTISKRSVVVHQINQDYIRAFCFKSRQIKTFCIENILAINPVDLRRGKRNYA